ncbi:MAG: AmmeMemoRadiSam system protein B [Candidatus Omnitrophota bacterium]
MDKSNIRKPAVAGQFYPATAISIQKQIDAFLPEPARKKDVIGCMLPHAGYMYSGLVAARTVARIVVKDTVVLLGPNHTGLGAAFSLMAAGIWQTPMGEVGIDEALSRDILAGSDYLENDDLAHAREHSLEVELPILQYFRKDFKIVPIAFGSDDFAALTDIGLAVARAVKAGKRQPSTLLAASSDMTHYEPAKAARAKDDAAIKAVLDLDARALWETVRTRNITMCGYMPVIAMITAARELGATKGELVHYATSGDVTGDNSSVVGYAGIIIY